MIELNKAAQFREIVSLCLSTPDTDNLVRKMYIAWVMQLQYANYHRNLYLVII